MLNFITARTARARAVALTLAGKIAISSVLRSSAAAPKLSECDQAADRQLRYKTRSLPW